MIEISGKEGKIQIAFALKNTYRDTFIFSNEEIPINDAYIIENNSMKEYCDGIATILQELKKYPHMIIIYINTDNLSDIRHLKAYVSRIEIEFPIIQMIIMHK